MKIFTAAQIKEWDAFTIKNEPIASIDLMERAAEACVRWINKQGFTGKNYWIFCGIGNNGGDGLAIARILSSKNEKVRVCIPKTGKQVSPDFERNLARLKELPVEINFISSAKDLPVIESKDIIIDALFGTGLNKKPEGIMANIIEHINEIYAHFHCEVIAIDMPSGMFADITSKENNIIWATHTLSFQCYKTAFLLPENAEFTGKVHILDIGLQQEFPVNPAFELIDKEIIHSIFKPRDPFAHKGNFGHALLIAGSHGKMGAAVLAARACLRSGVGLLTCHVPACGYDILQRGVPEAMVTSDSHESIITDPGNDFSKYASIGIGPGIGIALETHQMVAVLFDHYRKPIVIDADALNIIGADKNLLKKIPPGSLLSPHPKEFERLFGKTDDDFEKISVAQKMADEFQIIIVLKGHHTFIACPDGKGYFNSTGNAGMATGGTGDVLTGILTGLLAQGYSAKDAALLGVYIHGMAGDIAAKELSQEAMVASDIIEHIGEVYKVISVK